MCVLVQGEGVSRIARGGVGASIMQSGNNTGLRGTTLEWTGICNSVSKTTTSSKRLFILYKMVNPPHIYFLCFVHNAV
jgi:hypothetical protein